jgi:hypothetical protein
MCALAHSQALTVVLERLIRPTSLVLALYGLPNGIMRMPAMYTDLLAIVGRGESLSAARAMERCLFASSRSGARPSPVVTLASAIGPHFVIVFRTIV